MKSILITFAGILVFFGVLSFNAQAEGMNQPISYKEASDSQIILGGKVPEKQFKDTRAEILNVDVVFVRQSIVASY